MLDAVGEHPDAALGHFDTLEDFRRGKLGQLAVHRLAGVRSDCRDEDQPRHPVICSRGGDDGSAVRMADKQRGFAHTAQRAFDHRDVCRPGVEAVLRGHRLVPLSLQHGDYLVEARTVRPDPMTEHDARLSLHWLLHVVASLEGNFAFGRRSVWARGADTVYAKTAALLAICAAIPCGATHVMLRDALHTWRAIRALNENPGSSRSLLATPSDAGGSISFSKRFSVCECSNHRCPNLAA